MCNILSDVSGCNYVIVENRTLLGYYAASSGNFLQMLGITCQSHLQGSRILNPESDGTDRLSKTSVKNYHYLLRNNPDECSSQLLHGGSLKSRVCHIFLLSTTPYFDYFIYGHSNAECIPYLPKCKTTLRRPSQKKHICQVKIFLPKSNMTPPPPQKKKK